MSLAEEEKWQGAEIAKARALPRGMLRRRQATVTAVSAAGTVPRTVTLTFDSTPVPGVRVPAWYWPDVGDIVHTVKHHGDDLIIGPLSTADVDPYIAPTLENGWVDYGGGTHAPAGYYRDAGGRVWHRGLIKSGTIAVNTTLFILPVGYRPRYQEMFAGFNGTAAVTRIDVHPDGRVFLGTAAGNSTYLSIAGISVHAYA